MPTHRTMGTTLNKLGDLFCLSDRPLASGPYAEKLAAVEGEVMENKQRLRRSLMIAGQTTKARGLIKALFDEPNARRAASERSRVWLWRRHIGTEFARMMECLRGAIGALKKNGLSGLLVYGNLIASVTIAVACIPLVLLPVSGCISVDFRAPDPPQKTVDMLYDDDCDADIDCAITQPILNHWVDLGYAKVWGMVSSAHSQLGAPTLRVFRDYYGHSKLFPIGAWAPDCASKTSATWNIALVNKLDPGDVCTNYPSCTTVLRQAVANYIAQGGTPHGLDYVITGPLTCEEAFRNSLADTISPLTGKQMAQQYIRQFVVMSGFAPSGTEYNCAADSGACASFFANVTSQNDYPPVYVVPDNTGATQVFTQVPIAHLPKSNPTVIAFAVAGLGGQADEDSMSVEYSVYGNKDWATSVESSNKVNPSNGMNTWEVASPSGQYYLTVPGNKELFESVLSNPWLPLN